MSLEDTYSLVVESKQNINLSDKDLKTLVGRKISKRIEGFFDCDHNNLTSLEGSPEYVGGGFYCNSNNLTSLKGAPKYVGDCFYCHYNSLTSLEGLPEYIGGNVYYDDHLKKGENLYIIITSQIRGWYQGERNMGVMFIRIKKLFSK
jgi:hypothetical protein